MVSSWDELKRPSRAEAERDKLMDDLAPKEIRRVKCDDPYCPWRHQLNHGHDVRVAKRR